MREQNDPLFIQRIMLETHPQYEQTQCSLNEQILFLSEVAVKFGCYDAADYLKEKVLSESAPLVQRIEQVPSKD